MSDIAIGYSSRGPDIKSKLVVAVLRFLLKWITASKMDAHEIEFNISIREVRLFLFRTKNYHVHIH